MAINPPGNSHGFLSSPILKTKAAMIAKGYVVGGPTGAAAAANPSGPAAQALGLYNTGDTLAGGNNQPPVPVGDKNATTTDMLGKTTAMQRYAMTGQDQDHLGTINSGLEALRSMPPEVQQEYAPHLIRAQMMAEKNGGRRGY